MSAGARIRRLGRADAASLLALRKEALETDPLAFGASPEDDRGLSLDFLRRSLADLDEQAVFGCFDGDSLAGMVGVMREAKLKQRHAGGIWGMYVSPRARNKGNGRALLEAAVHQARAWGLEQVRLSVTEAAPVARSLYGAMGFRCWGLEPRALHWNARFVDEYHLALDLRAAPRAQQSPVEAATQAPVVFAGERVHASLAPPKEAAVGTDPMVIDCDGHILEPPDLWEKYLEPQYRDRAIRIRVGEDGFEYLEIAGKRAVLPRPGQLGTLGGMGKRVDEAKQLRERALRGEIPHDEMRGIRPDPERTYMRGAAFGTMDMAERLELLDREGLAKAILYPTIGLLWEAELMDPELSGAYCRAYNRWIADFCRDSAGRLIPIAHVSLGDPAGAALELERAVRDGCRGAFVCPFTITRIPHGAAEHDPVFAAAQDLDVPLAIHPTFEPPEWSIHQRFDKFGWAVWYRDLFAGHGVQHAFATLFQLGVFDRFPRLRVVVLESQAGWIGYFLDRADAIFTGTTLGATVRLAQKPSYYFKRQCFISADPDERTIAGLMPLVGEDKFFWASDYPHPDHPGNYLEELREMVAPMPELARRGILGENVAKAYKLR
jgi:predicted TIM-barrel fold metal-dependent hydrolase/GNAT superfamily N-acetyltransferase